MAQLTLMCAQFALFGALSVCTVEAAARGDAVLSAIGAVFAVGNLAMAVNEAAHFSQLVGG